MIDGWRVANPFDVVFPRMTQTLNAFMKGDARYVSLGFLAKRVVEKESEAYIEGLLDKFAQAEANLVCGVSDK